MIKTALGFVSKTVPVDETQAWINDVFDAYVDSITSSRTHDYSYYTSEEER